MSASETETGRQARWDRAFAEERSEALSGTLGACHASSGAYHQCNTAPQWYTVHIGTGPREPYRWCKRAAERLIVAGAVVEEGLRCPDCGGDSSHGGRELIPTFSAAGDRCGEDICEHPCHDSDREEEQDDD